eukprot:CAMPEP_0172543006 /NCGR_PEP_ID=MMETSP1067-20121228/13501_1 /TAXON_ID=265564 ORGANISM="Thalassiosira punctigera, Strain Tpunct2005C2" /NCGR_SAMPLE_ID=MMETSP1067 /ASSEMBLY_ACC=CAM_ASM_000444 /LENGTH=361 /DNA_ID=CAMNT_0013329333 /DNA_START=286 /DNA_END=1371 /DNA_ORIENTATION=-
MTACEKAYDSLATSLFQDVVDSSDPSTERVLDILAALRTECKNETITIATLESTKIGKALTKTLKACKRHRRTSDEKGGWDEAISTAEQLLKDFKDAADRESKQCALKNKAVDSSSSQQIGLPPSSSAYKARLVSQKKEMYKDPPALPPVHIVIEDKLVPKLKRNKTTGELTFTCGDDDSIESLLKTFHPNRTPEEVLRAGSFGGTYFRPITSAVTNVRYSSASVLKDTVKPEWILGLDKASMLTSSTYHTSVNKFGVKCGGSLGMWESSGWISDSDPYGWFQWYCRFYSGRRCSDDVRQIGRWCKSAGLKGRFRSQICNKIIAAGTTAGDRKISPVIRQTLLHWGLEVTEDVLEKHKRRK